MSTYHFFPLRTLFSVLINVIKVKIPVFQEMAFSARKQKKRSLFNCLDRMLPAKIHMAIKKDI
uniref:Uncharacterized protein n=1 Tax=Anguilla anguilla TaxID=7936 RepID=A0A0E9WRJ7_ANGAN